VNGLKLFKRSLYCGIWLYISPAFAVESISVQVAIRLSRCGAKGCGTYSSTDLLDFLLIQVTSAPAS
jgi:hypothetical protein